VWRRQVPAGSDLALLALLWLLLIVAFFSAAATKLPGYILPALPGGALLVALVFRPFPAVAAGQPPFGAGLRWSGWINSLLLAVAAVAAVLAPRWIGGDPAYPRFAAAIATSPLPWLLAVPLALSALVLVWLLIAPASAQRLGLLWAPNAAGFAAVLALVVPVLTPLLDRERLLPIRSLAQLAGAQARPGEPLLVVGYKRYSVVYYSGRPALFVSSASRARRLLTGKDPGPDGRPLPASTSPTVLLLGSDAELLEFGLGPGQATLLGRRDAHQLLRLPVQSLREMARR
jgi:4-amino-4-deoxy-L-arabinose transferase-like glycosyltransferase